MLATYIKAVALVTVLAVGWVAVQCAWRRAFRRECRFDPDVLASRRGCGSCGADDTCERRG